MGLGPSLKERILDMTWKIFVPIFCVVAIIWQIAIWKHNVETSGMGFAIFIIAFPCLVLFLYIHWMRGGTDPIVLIWNLIQKIIALFKKKDK